MSVTYKLLSCECNSGLIDDVMTGMNPMSMPDVVAEEWSSSGSREFASTVSEKACPSGGVNGLVTAAGRGPLRMSLG